MIKRASWFVAGATAGAVGVQYAVRKVKSTTKRLAPANVARSVADRARSGGRHVVDAVLEGRAAMRAKEAELRIRRDRVVEPIDTRLDPGDGLLVDGQPVDPSRVLIVRDR